MKTNEKKLQEFGADFEEVDGIIHQLIDDMLSQSKGNENQLVVVGFAFKMDEHGNPIVEETTALQQGQQQVFEIEPIVDAQQTEKSFLITASLPGIQKNEIDLQPSKKSLTITAWNTEQYFVKHIQLPSEIAPEKTNARFNNTVLEVELKKRKTRAPKEKIKID